MPQLTTYEAVRTRAEWVLSSVRGDGLVLEVAYLYGGCQDDLDEFTVA